MSNQVNKGSEAAEIIADEEKLHARVQSRIALGQDDGRHLVGAADLDKDLLELRDAVGEAKPEDLAPLVEQMTRLAAIRGRIGGSRTLPVDPASPYFAHMTLREQGKSRDVLVGKRGFIDRDSGVQIVDWRNAPVSRIYYRYEEGDDYEEEIAGRSTEGVVEVRRNVSIHGGRLRRIGAPQGTFVRDARNVWHQAVGQAKPVLQGGSGTAARAPRPAPRPKERQRGGRLGVHGGPVHRADKHLPEIAALIDREQFELISQPESGMVVIQGGAGSGKTTVALHRIAYLNFADARRFAANKILFVVPSQALVKYVAGVLPSLGVSGVPVVTYYGWARNTRQKLLRGTSNQYNSDTPEAVSRVKKHPALLALLDELVAEQVREAGVVLAEAAGGARGKVEGAWRELAAEALVPRLQHLHRWSKEAALDSAARIAVEGVIKKLRQRAVDVQADWAELLTDGSRLARGFADCPREVSDYDVRRTVQWCMQQLREAGPAVDAEGRTISGVDGQGVDDEHPGGRYDVEDDPILLRLIQLKRGELLGPDGHRVSYEHVAIDEAQDRSAIEVKVLLEAVEAHGGDATQRSVTIAGDTAQRVVFDNAFSSWQMLLEQIGHAALIRPLKLSYRSTAEVMELAREILGPELAPEEPLVARNGAPVELHEFGDIGEAVAFLGDALRGLMSRERGASVALIARHPEQAEAYFSGLRRAEVPALRLVRGDDFSFTPGVDVVDAARVKGLEFDYVIMVEVNASSYSATVEARHLFHIAATRAAHQLWLISTGEVSPLIPERLRVGGEGYVRVDAASEES